MSDSEVGGDPRQGGMATEEEPTDITAYAVAVRNDHVHGLHDGHDDGERCTYPGCDDAYWLLAQHEPKEN